MSTRIDWTAERNMHSEHSRELLDAEFEWTSVAFRRRFGPLVAVVARPRKNPSHAELTISHEGDVILEKTFAPTVRPEQASSLAQPLVLVTAVDQARAFADEWIASIRPREAP